MAKSTSTDRIILSLQSKIEEKRKYLEKSAKPVWKSSMVIRIEGGPVVNIHTLNEDSGIYVLATLISYKKALVEAITLIPGCSKTTEEVDNWMSDVLTKLEVVNRTNLLNSLKKDESELEALLSDSHKKEVKLKNILEKYNV